VAHKFGYRDLRLARKLIQKHPLAPLQAAGPAHAPVAVREEPGRSRDLATGSRHHRRRGSGGCSRCSSPA
jgi:hypothetical protein